MIGIMPPVNAAISPSKSRDTVSGIVESLGDSRLVLSIPGTDYRLHLALGRPLSNAGRRVQGTIHAKALRMHAAQGGGKFIEPIDGAPRIVAGRVVEVDQSRRRVLVDLGVAVWVTLQDDQKADAFAVGDMVNCYLHSGTTFEPASA